MQKSFCVDGNAGDENNRFSALNYFTNLYSNSFETDASTIDERNRHTALAHIWSYSNTSTYVQNAVVVDPIISGCMWLMVEELDRAGLGHTLASFLNYLNESFKNKLTLVAPFFTTAHGLSDVNETIRFFGLHSVFHGSRFFAQPFNISKIINVGNASVGCDSSSLRESVNAFTMRNNQSNCAKGNVVFLCFNKMTKFHLKIASSAANVLIPLRGSFLSGEDFPLYSSKPYMITNRLFGEQEGSYPSIVAKFSVELRLHNSDRDSHSQRRHTPIEKD